LSETNKTLVFCSFIYSYILIPFILKLFEINVSDDFNFSVSLPNSNMAINILNF
jgi:hypothetical protein